MIYNTLSEHINVHFFSPDFRRKAFYLGGFPGGSEVKASACNTGDLGSIPWSGRSPGEGNGNPLQYSCLENPMDRGAWWATIHGVTESDTTERLHFHFSLGGRWLPSDVPHLARKNHPFEVSPIISHFGFFKVDEKDFKKQSTYKILPDFYTLP